MNKLSILFTILLFIAPQALAQSVNIDLSGDNPTGGALSSKVVQIIGLITILSLAPSIFMMVTSFVRIVVVFSLLRTAIGLQQTPPNMVLTSLAIFLTFFIMAPTFEKSYEYGIKPLINEEITEDIALPIIAKPFHEFMVENTRDKDLSLFLDISKIKIEKKEDLPYHILVPSFMLSELKRAFEIGFLIFLPFLIIDLVVSSVLMAMGMMMLPPVLISMPFKLIFFVLIDGWYVLCGSLVKSYGIA
ncbi:flagellar biosynthetic protein [endosymbiont of Acanthamoeba sp. UWC8]|uniref:flagellar type III secretion system pore protein FliP n=1 Tax=endosymbiont of Acanthamoeba sp. UWC8 TaxID=86106 RepID=UPI0004D1D91F|nr:flagellar type III secretion system pore protein FliP [endosymbiont of Acanthamoeba sp. UWC8]AIF81453.1 flagellar biosynthetic protein [endosymbiont of Acanthamoeba sp. UWC8]